ncbi:MAG: hypothetical protein K6C68_13730 [Ruminococcus sp.]|nr:hypothetical protein [Ruminococcus sp.]
MNDQLSISAALNTAMKSPCSAQIKRIINKECGAGNLIKSFDKISLNNDECYYVLLFSKKPIHSYPNIRILHKKNGDIYQVLAFVDGNGCVEIRFHY